MELNNIRLHNFLEIYGYDVYYEIEGCAKISYNSIYVESKEELGNYCIVFAKYGYYLGELSENNIIRCWAKFKNIEEAYNSL